MLLPPDRALHHAWDAAETLPEHVVLTHLSGAVAREWWTPPLPEGLPIYVATTWVAAPPQGQGVRAYRHRDVPAYDLIDGLRVSKPAEILLTCARELSLLDMVILLDGAINAGVDLEGVRRAARRMRGAPALRRAIEYADPRSESAWETVLRLFHDAVDVPVTSQYDVYAEDGAWIARGDLWLRGTRTIHEYDGGGHREVSSHRNDLRRDRALANAGWTRRGYVADDVTVRFRSVLQDCDVALKREHDPRRLAAWSDLIGPSLFSPTGRQQYLESLTRPRTRAGASDAMARETEAWCGVSRRRLAGGAFSSPLGNPANPHQGAA